MSIYTLKSINNNAAEITKCSQKQTVKTEKERKESSIFTKQLSSITGESVNSQNVQNTINDTSEGANLEEMLGVYLTKSGKAANATITNEKGQTETVAIKDLSLNELKAVAKGDTNALKERDAKVRANVEETTGKKSKKSQESKDSAVTAENQERPDYQKTVFGGISAQASHIKTYKNTDDVREFAQATKEISDMSDIEMQQNVQAGGGDPVYGAISVSNGDKIIRNASERISQLTKDSKQIKENIQDFNIDFQQDSSHTRTMHNRSESLNNKAEKKKETTEKKISDDAKEIANTSSKFQTASNVAPNSKQTQKQTNPIKSGSSNFLGLTKSSASKSSASNLMTSFKSSEKVTAKTSEKSGTANTINNNISKTNEAQNTLKENTGVINDTNTKAQEANNYVQVSENLAANVTAAAADFENQAKAMADASDINSSNADNYQTNAEIFSNNAEACQETAETLGNQSVDTQAAALAYRQQATEDARIAMSMKYNNEEEFLSISITELACKNMIKDSEEDIADAENAVEHGKHTKNKGAQYENRGRVLMGTPGTHITGSLLLRRGHNIDKKGRTQIKKGSHKKFIAETAKMDAENKIAEVNRQREEYIKDVNNEQNVKTESKAASKKSKTLEKTSATLKDRAQQEKDNAVTNEKAASSFENVAKSYKEKSKEEGNLASLNAALANDKSSEAQEYSQKAGAQKNIGLKLENIAQNQETKQEKMSEKVNENIEKNDKNAKAFNESQNAEDKKQPNVEKFHKENGAEKTDVISKNEQDNKTSDALDNDAQNAQDIASGVDNSMGLLVHADRVFVSHLVFGVENDEETDENKDAENNEEDNKTDEVQETQNQNDTNNGNNQNDENIQNIQTVENTAAANLNIKKLG